MAEKSSFFNSVGGDRKYSASDWASYFSALIGNGTIITPDGQLLVTAAARGVGVNLAPGNCYINGYHYENTAPLSLTAENGKYPTPDGTHPRIDRVVIRWSRQDRAMEAAVIAGAPALNPEPPALTRTADVYEVAVAEILVPRGAEYLRDSDITDLRRDDTTAQDGVLVGGFARWNFADADPEHSLSSLFSQLTGSFENWFASVQAGFTAEGPSAEVVSNVATLVQQMAALVGENADPQSITPISEIQESVGGISSYLTENASIRRINIAQTSITTDALLPANGSWFPRQSIIPRSVANNYDAILIIFRFCANPVSGTYKLNKIGTKATDKLLDGLADYAVEIPLVIRKGETGRVVYTDRTGRVFSRTVAWLTADHSILCQGAAGKVSARWGLTSSAGSNETAVETYKNAIYIGDARYKVVSAGDLNKYAPNVKDMYIAQADPYPASGTGPDAGGSYFAHVNNSKTIKDYDQFLLPMAFYGIKAASGN